MKHKTKLMLASAAVCVLAAVAAAGLVPAESAAETQGNDADGKQAYISGDYSYTVKADGTAEITGYSGSGTDITVPGELDGHAVTSIGSEAFMENEQIKSVGLPDSVGYRQQGVLRMHQHEERDDGQQTAVHRIQSLLRLYQSQRHDYAGRGRQYRRFSFQRMQKPYSHQRSGQR